MSTELKNKVINGIIDVEKGYVNHPNDRGGPTNFGITEKVAREHGYKGSMEDMPREFAFDVYSKSYWDINRLDSICRLSEKVGAEVADSGVLHGPRQAALWLQRSLTALNKNKLFDDLVIDGLVGSKTIAALERVLKERNGETILLKGLNCYQGAFMQDLSLEDPNQRDFTYGWIDLRVAI